MNLSIGRFVVCFLARALPIVSPLKNRLNIDDVQPPCMKEEEERVETGLQVVVWVFIEKEEDNSKGLIVLYVHQKFSL